MSAHTAPATDQWSARQSEERQYRRLYLASLPLFLVIATVMRLVPGLGTPFRAAAGARKSIFAEAREAAHVTIGFAFMH